MHNSLNRLVLLAAVVVLLALPQNLYAGMGITIKAGDSFQTGAISLAGFKLGANQPAGTYSFRMLGINKPGVVEVRVLDNEGNEVGRLHGHFAGNCPGKPQKATFAELGYSSSSPISKRKENTSTRITVECKQGSRIELTLVDG